MLTAAGATPTLTAGAGGKPAAGAARLWQGWPAEQGCIPVLWRQYEQTPPGDEPTRV